VPGADFLRRLVRRRTYDPAVHGLHELGRQLVVPSGQSVYDPDVFGRYDLQTQRVVPRDVEDPGVWALGFDEIMGDAQREARARPEAIVRDRYDLALALLAPGSGTCLDACTASPDPTVRSRVEALGYEYRPVDIDGDGVDVGREDVTALSFADGAIPLIISLDTLEHVEDYRAALAEFHRVLAPGGVLVLHVPAYYFDRAESAPLDPDHDPWGHVRYFSGRELFEAVRATGLVIQRAQLHLDYGAALCIATRPLG
jgi:SAM-dependent methyltransferase